jgi:Ras-related protein Rab-8A
MLKLIIVGDSGVGKSNIISAFCNSDYHFAANHVPTIGVDFSTKLIQLENKRVKLQVWDTAGQERFRTITETYYKGAAGIFLVYSVGNRESFNNVSN